MDDIFALARQKQNLGSNAQVAAPPMLASNGPQGQVASKDQNESKLGDILTKPSGPTQSSQDIMNMISKLGINSKDIPMTASGKQLLMNRIKNTGNSTMNADQVNEVMSAFDNHLSRYSDVASKNEETMLSQAKNTLSAIKEWN